MGCGGRRQGVMHVVAPPGVQLDRVAAVWQMQPKAHPCFPEFYFVGPYRRLLTAAEQQPLGTVGYRQGQNPAVIGIDNRRAFWRQGGKEFALGPGHTIQATQGFKVGGTDIDNHPDLRLGNFRQAGNLAQSTHAHLQHRPAMFLAQSKEGLGQSH